MILDQQGRRIALPGDRHGVGVSLRASNVITSTGWTLQELIERVEDKLGLSAPPLSVSPATIVISSIIPSVTVQVGGTAEGAITVTRGTLPTAVNWTISGNQITFTGTPPSSGAINGLHTVVINRGGYSADLTVDLFLESVVPTNPVLDNLPVGSVVRLRLGGVWHNFIIIHQGSPSAAYVGFEGRTTLLKEVRWVVRHMHPQNMNDYANTQLHVAGLNNELFNLFDSDIRSHIAQVRIPYRPGFGTSPNVFSGTDGLLCRIFLLSHAEVGSPGVVWPLPEPEGVRMSHFIQGNSSEANVRRRIITSAPHGWFLRTPRLLDTMSFFMIDFSGGATATNSSTSTNVRPALTLPNNLLINANGEIIA